MSGPESKLKIIEELKKQFNPANSMVSNGVKIVAEVSSESLEDIQKKEQQALSDFLEAKKKSKRKLSGHGFSFVSNHGSAIGVVQDEVDKFEPSSGRYYFIDKNGEPINKDESGNLKESGKFDDLERIKSEKINENIFIGVKKGKKAFFNEFGEKISRNFDSCFIASNGDITITRNGVEDLVKLVNGKFEIPFY